MPKSNFVFEEGSAIGVGTHGETEYLFHSGDPVPNRGESGFVFESGTRLGPTGGVIDDFERGNLDPYTTGTGAFEVTSNNVWEGNNSLEWVGGNDNTVVNSEKGMGLPAYPEPGDTFAVYWYSTGFRNIDLVFGGDLDSGLRTDDIPNDSYYVYCASEERDEDNYTVLTRSDDGEPINISDNLPAFSTNYLNEWVQFFVDWREDGTIIAEIQDSDGETIIGPLETNDTTYDYPMIGFYVDAQAERYEDDSTYWDFARKVA